MTATVSPILASAVRTPCYRAEGREGCAFEIHVRGRDSRDQHAGHTDKFRMNGKARPGAGNPVAGFQVGNPFSHFHDNSGTAVAESERLIEAAADSGNGRYETVATDFI
jgi:hypothetical protein